MFQEATRLKLSWHALVPNELASRWSAWLMYLENLYSLICPRCINPAEFADGSIELHHCCDASELGYDACTYTRTINHIGNIHVALLASKARLAPIKQVTIPRLEVMAAVVASKLDVMIRRELVVPLLKSTFWTDSLITLAYIHSDSRIFKVFVANRMSLIRENTKPDQRCHITGMENPADILSRGCNASSIPPVWINGPPSLSEYNKL